MSSMMTELKLTAGKVLRRKAGSERVKQFQAAQQAALASIRNAVSY